MKILGALQLSEDDEAILVDNSPAPMVPAATGEPHRVLRAAGKQSSYYARNLGAEAARHEWILFLDADTRPLPLLLDCYFDRAVEADHGVLAGEVMSAPEQTTLAARHMTARDHLSVEPLLTKKPFPTGVTANLLVRKAMWEQLGGFHEVRSGADFEFCWRAQDAGWRLGYRPDARVMHLHSESVGAMLRKARRYGPGQSWLNRRYPGSAPRPRLLRALARAVAGGIIWTLAARTERARFKLLDGLWTCAYAVGYFSRDNRPSAITDAALDRTSRASHRRPAAVIVGYTFGDRDASVVTERAEALRELVGSVRVVAARRGFRLDRAALALAERSTGVEARFLEDEPGARRLQALVPILLRHPARIVRALRSAESAGGEVNLRRSVALVGAVAAAVSDLDRHDLSVEAVDWQAGGAVASALLCDLYHPRL